jgi:hypothetical protein
MYLLQLVAFHLEGLESVHLIALLQAGLLKNQFLRSQLTLKETYLFVEH